MTADPDRLPAEATIVGLEDCVQLLRGPSDERRYVGS